MVPLYHMLLKSRTSIPTFDIIGVSLPGNFFQHALCDKDLCEVLGC
jgi:hypothetical protein